jgi:hypothetical protein
MTLISRSVLYLFPLIYMFLIWQQTSHFDPESVSGLSVVLSETVILAIGAFLELAHLFEFGILYFLIIIAILSYGHLNKWKEFLAIAISLLYGLSDEIHQIYVPFRTFSFVDILKDTVGVLAIWFIIHKKYYGKRHSRIASFLLGITTFFKKDKTKITFL